MTGRKIEMSGKGMKKIRKMIRNEVSGQAILQARWRFPWSLWPKRKKGWITIPMFPKKRQFRFEFRMLDQVKMKTGKATIGER